MTTCDHPQSQPADVGYSPRAATPQPLPHSAMAIAGLVLGILGLLTSFLPIINNFSFILGILGLVFAGVGMTGCLRGKRTGKAMAIAALVLNILTVVVVLASQAAMSAAIDGAQKALEGAAAVSSTAAAASTTGQSSTDQPADASSSTTDLPLGTEVTLSNGLVISVDSVTGGLQDYDGSPITEVRVTYRNDGTSDASFSTIDWKTQDTQGVLDSSTIFLEGTDDLHSGTLVPGGAVSVTVYFDGDAAKVYYYSSLFSNNAAATWLVA